MCSLNAIFKSIIEKGNCSTLYIFQYKSEETLLAARMHCLLKFELWNPKSLFSYYLYPDDWANFFFNELTMWSRSSAMFSNEKVCLQFLNASNDTYVSHYDYYSVLFVRKVFCTLVFLAFACKPFAIRTAIELVLWKVIILGCNRVRHREESK